MADQIYIPEDDEDLKLARAIGEKLQSSRPLSEIDDPLIPLLVEYKEWSQSQSSGRSADSSGIWRQIQQETGSKNLHTTSSPINRRGTRWTWAAAASILIIITAGLLLYLNPFQQPTLLAESGNQVEIFTLEDGSQVTLRPNSKFYLLDENSQQTNYMLTGEAFFDVMPNQDQVFSVTSGNGKVSVLGTKFVLSNWGDIVQVYLQEGRVKLEALDTSESVILEPGQVASLDKTELVEPRQAEIDLFTDWLDNELTFRNQSASYVFAELEQHFNISINVPDEIKETKIGGTMRLDSLNQSLDYLELILNGTFENTGEKEYTFTTVD